MRRFRWFTAKAHHAIFFEKEKIPFRKNFQLLFFIFIKQKGTEEIKPRFSSLFEIGL